MCILASREHTCIDPIISKGPKKNEECKNKLDVSRVFISLTKRFFITIFLILELKDHKVLY